MDHQPSDEEIIDALKRITSDPDAAEVRLALYEELLKEIAAGTIDKRD